MFSPIWEYQGSYYKKNTKNLGYLDKIGDLSDRFYYKGLSYRALELQNDSEGPRRYRGCVYSEIV
jgi:hypothetical protein